MSVKIAVLASGSGSNLQALIDAQKKEALAGAQIVLVLSDRKDAYALTRAKEQGISTRVLSPGDFSSKGAWEAALRTALLEAEADWILLAGFLRILSGAFIDHFAGRIVNIHPSLLPRYGGEGYYGLRVHRAVLENREEESGASVHFVVEGCDEGPVILQKTVKVEPGDTPETLQKRVLEVEHEIYPEAVRRLVKGLV